MRNTAGFSKKVLHAERYGSLKPGDGMILRAIDRGRRWGLGGNQRYASSDACGYNFQPGTAYFIYAYRTPEGLETTICSRTKPLADAAEDLAYLRVAPTSPETSDVQIVVEFWVDDDANSGVFFRCSDPKTINGMTAYEAQIFDKRPDPEYRTGALTFFSKPAATINTGGKWNTYEITAQGSRFILTLNGTRTVDVQDTKFARGPIALQRTAGIVKFRSVRVRPL